MSTKSKVRTIIAIVLGALMILPLFLGLWTSSYWGTGLEFDANNNVVDEFAITKWAADNGYDVSKQTYNIWDSLKDPKEICDVLFCKGGAFSFATLAKVMLLVAIVASLLLVIVEILRLCNVHLTEIERFLTYTLFFAGILAFTFSCLFFVGSSCRGASKYLYKDVNGFCMMFKANVGWYFGVIVPFVLGIIMMSTKPHTVKKEQ